MRILNLETDVREEVNVELVQVASKLKGINKGTGWYINWVNIFRNPVVEVYAIRTNDGEAQGLIALSDDKDNKAIKIEWAVAAPHNNKLKSKNGSKKYEGVGACLFSIAAYQSVKRGYGGYIYGCAANEKLLHYYENAYDAEFFGIVHPYHFVCNGKASRALLEVYVK